MKPRVARNMAFTAFVGAAFLGPRAAQMVSATSSYCLLDKRNCEGNEFWFCSSQFRGCCSEHIADCDNWCTRNCGTLASEDSCASYTGFDGDECYGYCECTPVD